MPAFTADTWKSPWPEIFGAVGLNPSGLTIAFGASHGVQATGESVTVRRILDVHRPQLEIYWQEPQSIPRYSLPKDAKVFAWERWTNSPVLAGFPGESGPVLWLATEPGTLGYERYPYLLQALHDLGYTPPATSRDLWAFFDSSYRLRANPEILARNWRQAGIAVLQIAAWHYWEPDPQRDAWLAKLIETCHRHGIQTYAWIEFPHVSEKFWTDHPEWREKTALLGDAHLDWRKLINLRNPDCARQVQAGLRALIARFDWDGVNLGELYFESLEGYGNPARFTPMNDDVRREFASKVGFDPLELFGKRAKDAAGMRKFLDYRIDLAGRLQEEWLGVLAGIRELSPHLDLVLTHIDDRFDTQIPDLLGADASRVMPLLAKFDFTFLVEDPATIWHLGPQRYTEIAKRYTPLTKQRERLAIDINVVERYQDVYPTKQQTGVELLQLVHGAARAFERVAIYFENSILPPDLSLLPAAAAGSRVERIERGLIVESPRDVWVAWKGPAKVDGKTWAVWDGKAVRVPAGRHQIEPSVEEPLLQIVDLNARLVRCDLKGDGVEVTYESRPRAIVKLSKKPMKILMDDSPVELPVSESEGAFTLSLPAGRHTVYFAATS